MPVVGAHEPDRAPAAAHRVALVEPEHVDVEVLQRPAVLAGHDDVAHPHVTGYEGAHEQRRPDRLVVEDRAVEQLDRVAAGVVEPREAGDPALVGLGVGAFGHLDPVVLDGRHHPLEVPLVEHLEADGGRPGLGAGRDDEAWRVVVHPVAQRLVPVFVDRHQPEEVPGERLPRVEVGRVQPEVAERKNWHW